MCVCVCMQIYTHKNCQPYQKQYSFIFSTDVDFYQVNCAILENHLKH